MGFFVLFFYVFVFYLWKQRVEIHGLQIFLSHVGGGGGRRGGGRVRELMSSTRHKSNDCFLQNFVP